jgi:hypothetical protein
MAAGEPSAGPPPRLVRLAFVPLVLAPIRLGLAALGLLAALLVGADGAVAGTAFAFGAGVTFALLLTDRRSILARRPAVEPMPPGALHGPWSRVVLSQLFPSTAGLTVLAAVSIGLDGALTAALAGLIAGMGLAAVVSSLRIAGWERREHAHLLGEVGRGRRLFAQAR